ncbi:MAG: S8 family serine peptidase, partial [Candidatus Brocadiales bacterium]
FGAAIIVANTSSTTGTTSSTGAGSGTGSASSKGIGALARGGIPGPPSGGGGDNGGGGGKGKKVVKVALSTDKTEYVSGTDETSILTAVVTDKKGNAITGLVSPDNFATTLNGNPASVTFTETITSGTYTGGLNILGLADGSHLVEVTVTDGGVSGTDSATFNIVSAPTGGRLVYMAFGFENMKGSETRKNIMQDVLDYLGTSKTEDTVLLVDDDGGDNFELCYTAALDTLGYIYNVYTVPLDGDGPDLATMTGKTVIWFTGDEPNLVSGFLLSPTLSKQDQGNLKKFLDNGKLFLTGEDIGWDLVELGNGASFYENTLHAKYLMDTTDVFKVLGVSGTAFDGRAAELVVDDCAQRPLSPLWPSGIAPNDGAAVLAMEYETVALFSGTSMATPHVTAVASLIRGLLGNPAYQTIKASIMNSADPKGYPVVSGGRLNAKGALDEAAAASLTASK